MKITDVCIYTVNNFITSHCGPANPSRAPDKAQAPSSSPRRQLYLGPEQMLRCPRNLVLAVFFFPLKRGGDEGGEGNNSCLKRQFSNEG